MELVHKCPFYAVAEHLFSYLLSGQRDGTRGLYGYGKKKAHKIKREVINIK